MFDKLIEALRDSGTPVDGDSLADTLWLAMAMRTEQAAEQPPGAPAAPEEAWIRGRTTPPDTQEPAVHVIPPTYYGNLGWTEEDERKSPVTPVPPSRTAGRSAPLGTPPSLPDLPAFKRAIKPLRSQRRQPSRRLDERAMVKRLVEEGPQALEPLFQPGSRRTLRLSLIREHSSTEVLWSHALDELAALFRGQGTFKLQREWSLEKDPVAGPVLRELNKNGRAVGPAREACKIKWWPGEIILIASDFTSTGWWDGIYLQLLHALAAQQPVSLLHTLPARLWTRTWTGKADAMVTSARGLAATRTLDVRVARMGMSATREDARLAIPLIELAPQPLNAWAKLVTGGADALPAILLDQREPEHPSPKGESNEDPSPVDPSLLSMQYRMASSPLARSLAQHLSVTAPLSFPIMRWVQQAMLPQSDASHLAEFVLGGLLKALPAPPGTPADAVTYDFIEGVRPLLQQGMPKALGLQTQFSVGQYLETLHTGAPDMRAVVETWSDEKLQELSSEQQAFAVMSRTFLERIGWRRPPARTGTSTPGDGSTTPPKPPEAIETDSPDTRQLQRVRQLTEPVTDMQWSPFLEGRLAILTTQGIDIWHPAYPSKGWSIQRANKPALPQQPLTLYWWVPAEAEDEGAKLEPITMIVRKVTEALTSSLPGQVRIRRLRNPLILLRRRNPAQALLVFQTEDYGRWMDANPERFNAIEQYIRREGTLSASVQMSAGRAFHGRSTRKLQIDEADLLNPGELSRALFWERLSELVNQFVKILRQQLQAPSNGRPTAISWLSKNSLVIANYDGKATRISALDLDDESHLGASSSTLLASHPHQSPLTHLVVIQGHSDSAAAKGGPDFSLTELACMDARGAVYVHDGAPDTRTQKLISGRGLPRRLGFWPSTDRLWVHGEDTQLLSPVTTPDLKKIDVPLLSICDPSAPSPWKTLLHDQVLACWTLDDKVFAITAAGYLHQGSIDDLRGFLHRGKNLDNHPARLSGILREAAVSADGTRFATLNASGRLDIWEARKPSCIESVQVVTSLADIKQVRIALSATGQSVAFSDGRTVRIIETPLSSEAPGTPA